MPNRKASTFNTHCIIALSKFGKSNLKSLTVDRCKEFAGYLELENKLDLDVYFADPYSSWQRGTNENTNGLIREFFPKKFDFSTIDQNDVDIVEYMLGFKSFKSAKQTLSGIKAMHMLKKVQVKNSIKSVLFEVQFINTILGIES